MKFKKILKSLIKKFEEEKIRYGLIGGLSLIFHGIPRTTFDIDFLIDKKDLEKLDKIMKRMKFKLFFRTENVSQFIKKEPYEFEVDFIHAFRKYSLEMLDRISEKELEGIKIKVLKPEDIIGLKIQAMVNDKTREEREIADIVEILKKFKGEINWSLVKNYFKIFNLEDIYEDLKEKYG